MKAVIIGSGFSGLVSSALIAKQGHEVQLLEKNQTIGGRARNFSADGFTFDMGPSWYWMPDVFERFFNYFGKQASDYYQLERLNPGFKIFFENDELNIPDSLDELRELFEKLEPGSAKALDRFLSDAKYKYEVGVQDIIYRQPDGIKPYLDIELAKASIKLQLFKSISRHIRRYFKHPYLIQLLEFPVLFLGAKPDNTPALYSMMDYAGLKLGTWYPIGGFHEVIKAMASIAEENGVQINTNKSVIGFETKSNKVTTVLSDSAYSADAIVMAGDYQHFDSKVTPIEYRQYSDKYWEKRVLAPSSLIYYLGHRGLIDKLEHHNLFFDADFDEHSREIYEEETFPKNPLFYVCCPSKTDTNVAPQGSENLFILIPVSAGLQETDDIKEHYFQLVSDRILSKTGVDIRLNITYRRDYAISDFKEDYNSYKGNAYGLANTLKQTAFLKPTMKHKTLKNVFFSGQLTSPGPGVPPAIVSGELAANYVNKYFKSEK